MGCQCQFNKNRENAEKTSIFRQKNDEKLCDACFEKTDGHIIEHSFLLLGKCLKLVRYYFKRSMFSFHWTSYLFRDKRRKSHSFLSYYYLPAVLSHKPMSSKHMTNENCTCQSYHSINQTVPGCQLHK